MVGCEAFNRTVSAAFAPRHTAQLPADSTDEEHEEMLECVGG
jgi:hypothetical protein